MSQSVRKILDMYASESIGCKTNLHRLLMHGPLAGTGRFLVLAVDQGFEHGPRAFVMNPPACDPAYHYQLAKDAGVSAFTAPLGLLESCADEFLGDVPTILKVNNGNSLYNKDNPPNQAITASVGDALRLGSIGIGLTIYPGSDASYDMFEEAREIIAEAKACGLLAVVWSYARGNMTKTGETALDVIAYGAHMAALLGAHVIKVKIPSAHLEFPEAREVYEKTLVPKATEEERIRHVVQSCFNGRRLVGFSGGETKDTNVLKKEFQAIVKGGGSGSFLGRNAFQRQKTEALPLIHELIDILKQ